MDAALLAEREAFKRKAMAVPVIENKKKKAETSSSSFSNASSSQKARGPPLPFQERSSASKFKGGPGSQIKFNVLAKIVKHMKSRYMDGMDHPLTLDEILDETNQLDVSSKTKEWLVNEALKSNPKIKVEGEGLYGYNPPFNLRDKKSLLKMLKQKDLRGEGGVMYDDVVESLPKADAVVQSLTTNGRIIQILRPVDKKKVLYYYDHSTDLDIDDEFIKQWRSVSVDGVDNMKIEKYLDEQGIRSMQDQGLRKLAVPKRKKVPPKRKNRAPRDNEHLADILVDYSEKK